MFGDASPSGAAPWLDRMAAPAVAELACGQTKQVPFVTRLCPVRRYLAAGPADAALDRPTSRPECGSGKQTPLIRDIVGIVMIRAL
jgi:hypothetical protein